MIKIIAMAAAAGALAGSLLAGYFMAEYKDATWSAATNELKIEAAVILQVETQRVDAVENIAYTKVRELEAQHVQEAHIQADLQRRNRELVAKLGGLRHPGRRASGSNTMPTATTRANSIEDSSTPSYLSPEASGLFLSASTEVGALANYARTCYEWKKIVTMLFEQEKG